MVAVTPYILEEVTADISRVKTLRPEVRIRCMVQVAMKDISLSQVWKAMPEEVV